MNSLSGPAARRRRLRSRLGMGSHSDQLASYINGLNLGVTANVVTDSTGARVALVSNSSGSASDFSLSPDSGSSPSFFMRAATGTDVFLTVDGIPITSSTNTVTGAINGVTLFLNGQAAGTESGGARAGRTCRRPRKPSTALAVTAYNSLISDVNSQFTYDLTNQTSGPLASDSTVRMFQSELLAAPNYSGSGERHRHLREPGHYHERRRHPLRSTVPRSATPSRTTPALSRLSSKGHRPTVSPPI